MVDTILITFVSLKGGVGKSTHLAALAAGLLHKGKSVLVIDTDAQGTSEKWATEVAQSTNDLTFKFLDLDGMGLEEANTSILEAAQGTDFVLMDTPGSATPAVTAAMLTSDLVLSPFMLTEPDIAGLERSQELFKRGAESVGEDPETYGNLVGLYVGESAFISNARKKALENLSNDFPIRKGLTRTPILADWMGANISLAQLQNTSSSASSFTGKQAERITGLVIELTEVIEGLVDA